MVPENLQEKIYDRKIMMHGKGKLIGVRVELILLSMNYRSKKYIVTQW